MKPLIYFHGAAIVIQMTSFTGFSLETSFTVSVRMISRENRNEREHAYELITIQLANLLISYFDIFFVNTSL